MTPRSFDIESLELEARSRTGLEDLGGGASHPAPPGFNGGTCTACLDAFGLGSGAPIRIVVTFMDSSGNPLATETVTTAVP